MNVNDDDECRQYGIQWEHEDASVMMLEHLVDDNHIEIDKEDLHFVQRLIKGECPSPDHPKSKYPLFTPLFQYLQLMSGY